MKQGMLAGTQAWQGPAMTSTPSAATFNPLCLLPAAEDLNHPCFQCGPSDDADPAAQM